MARTTNPTRSTTTTTKMDNTAIQECHDACVQTISYCLEQGGDHAKLDHIRLMQDCVDICRVSTDVMLRGSQFRGALMEVCADICKACEESCEEFEGDDTMEECAKACRNCADACRRMTG